MDPLNKDQYNSDPTGFLRSRFRLLIPLIVVIAILIAGLWAGIVALRPLPPRTVLMVTGPEGGSFYEMGKQYQELLSHHGIKVELLSTGGAMENLQRLLDPRSRVEIGFLQGGFASAKKSPDLESLGTVCYEPLWFFYRSAIRGKESDIQIMHGRGLEFLRGRKISIGPEGSGTKALALELLSRNGIDNSFAQLLSLTHRDAGEKLIRGEIDAALMMTSWDAPVVQQLLSDKNIEIAGFPRADAYVALFPFLNKLTLPAGVVDLAKNRPPTDVTLFAPKASLIVRKDLHPAIQYLLLDAASQIHSDPGIFQKSGQFPAAESIDLPLSEEARQFYKSGRPFLQRHLPFWLAVLIDRLWILLIPAAAVIYPLLRFTPALYAWEIRWRIFRLYGDLRLVEKELGSRGAEQSIEDLNEQLDRIEEKANNLKVPLFYSSVLYNVRMHITLVRENLKKRKGTPGPAEKTEG